MIWSGFPLYFKLVAAIPASEVLGHQSVQSTHRYSHLAVERKRELVEQVLNSNASIKVVVGGSDRVVSANHVKSFFGPYRNRIEVVEMEGLGHDPFEEDMDQFLGILQQVLESESEDYTHTSPSA